MNHFIKVCRLCGAVIAQCRCPWKDKPVEYGICEACAHGATVHSVDYVEAPDRNVWACGCGFITDDAAQLAEHLEGHKA